MTFGQLVLRVAHLTDRNCHTESILEIANFFEMEPEAEELANVLREHFRLGHLSTELYHRRCAVYERVMARAKSALPPADYDRLYQAL